MRKSQITCPFLTFIKHGMEATWPHFFAGQSMYHGSLDVLPWCLHHNIPQSPHEKELQVSSELAMTPRVKADWIPPCQLCPSNAANFWVSIDCWVGLSTIGKNKGNMDGKSLWQAWNHPCWTATARTPRDRQAKNPRHRDAADAKKSCSSQRGAIVARY